MSSGNFTIYFKRGVRPEWVYEDVLPLPRLEEASDRVRRNRVLLIVSPDSKIPPKEVQKFFEGLTQKNHVCVLTARNPPWVAPRRSRGPPAAARQQPLDMSRDTNKPFDGEAQIEKTLTADPLKLYLDVEKNFFAIRETVGP